MKIPTILKISLLLGIIPIVFCTMMLVVLFNSALFGSQSFLYSKQIYAVIYGMGLITIISIVLKIREYIKKEKE